MEKNFLKILGCGGFARQVATVYLDNNPNENIIFVDENAKIGEKILGYDVVKICNEKVSSFVAFGDNEKRKIYNCNELNIISKTAFLGRKVMLGLGNFVGIHSIIECDNIIGNGNIINTSSIISHECQIGDYCHISVNATICGKTTLGNNIFVGAGATIIDKINICDNVIIGANSTVINDITEPGFYVGCPVHKIN